MNIDLSTIFGMIGTLLSGVAVVIVAILGYNVKERDRRALEMGNAIVAQGQQLAVLSAERADSAKERERLAAAQQAQATQIAVIQEQKHSLQQDMSEVKTGLAALSRDVGDVKSLLVARSSSSSGLTPVRKR